MRFFSALSLALVLACGSAQAATFVFTEGDFAPGSMSLATLQGPGGGQVAAQSSNGVPGTAHQVTTTQSVAVATAHILVGASVDPTVSALESVGFSIDFTPVNAFGQGQAVGLILRQDGNYFSATSTITGASGTGSFVQTGLDALVEADFTDFDAFNGSGNPVDMVNFSGGGVIEFGFFTANQGGGGISIAYDNLRIEAAAVPVPAALPLAVTALAGLGALGWRRRARARATSANP
ncbi:MAG: hypothetical protein AAF092_18430 [Pseudomonadota bacterium]